MYKVYMTQIKDAGVFDLEVKKHIARLKAFNFEKNKPRPTAEHPIDFCVIRVQVKGKPDDYMAQYEVIDDREKENEGNP